ncbi:MAG: teichoic acid D-Ala incorporation-associated protein DltX [Isosphaeraceae bacterium]
MNPLDQRDNDRVLLSKWFARPWARFAALTLYYLGILVALVALYGQGDFSTPPFIYQNF